MKNRRLLVTGGAGFIGANFVNYWLEHNPNDYIVVLDALTYAGSESNLSKALTYSNFEFVQGNINDSALVKELLTEKSLNTVVNFAAESHVDRSISAPDAFIETNINGTYSLLKVAKEVWQDQPARKGQQAIEHRFHHVSTDEVYGSLEPTDPAFNEQTVFAPNSPYSASKAASDHLVRAYFHTFGLQVTTSNCSNNYGPLHYPEKLIPLVMTNILENKVLPIYGDGLQIRDWLYVDDHIRGIELVLKKGTAGETYNIGGNNEWANIDIVKLICTLMNNKFKAQPELKVLFPKALNVINGQAENLITYVEDRAGHDRRYAIDATKITNDLGYNPKESFETGICKTLDEFINQKLKFMNK